MLQMAMMLLSDIQKIIGRNSVYIYTYCAKDFKTFVIFLPAPPPFIFIVKDHVSFKVKSLEKQIDQPKNRIHMYFLASETDITM